jgi:hypothetical protein
VLNQQEVVLDVEYTTAVLPPQLSRELPHDDWCVAALLSKLISTSIKQMHLHARCMESKFW